MKHQVWEDFSKLPKFKSYPSVPIGFEIVQDSFRSYPAELNEKLNLSKEECAAALWGGTGMPLEEHWDEEIRHINEIQGKLGEIPNQSRTVRCQVSSYDMMHYNYTRSIPYLLDAIKAKEYKHIAPNGWRIPWWPPNQEKRVELLDVYITFIQAWDQKQKSLTIRTSKQYKNEVLRKIYAKLGEWSALKSNYVKLVLEKLESSRSIYTVPEAFWSEREKIQYDILVKNKLEQVIRPIEVDTNKNRDEDVLVKRIEEFKRPLWHHSFFNEIDSWLDCIGKGIQSGFDKESQEVEKNIIKTCTNFTSGLTLFMSSYRSESKVENKPAGIDKNIVQIINGLKKMFNDPSDVQLWLLACMWKTFKEQLKKNIEGTASTEIEKLKNDWLYDL